MILYGYYINKYPNASGKDLMIYLDNHFIAINNQPMTDKEKLLVDNLYDQVWVMLKMDGMNRQDLRKIAKKK